jgi:uncharacterized membrane protein YkgB
MAKSSLIIAQFFVSLGGLLLHFRIHPAVKDGVLSGTYAIPTALGIFDVVVITLLLCWPKTVTLGFLLNGMFCIVGVIMMAAFAFAHPPADSTFIGWTLNTTLSDILLLVGDFFIVRGVWLAARQRA